MVLALLLFPAFYGYNNAGVYYDMSSAIPNYLPSITANRKLESTFDMATSHLVLVDSDVSQADVCRMTDEMEQVDGVKQVISLDSLLGAGIPEAFVPDEILSKVKSDRYQLMLVSSEYVCDFLVL